MRTDRAPRTTPPPPLQMKTATGHSSSFFSEKFSHLNIDKVCHRQALFVFLLLLLLHISSHALALSPVSVLHFSSPSPIFAPRRQLCSKSRGLSRENRRVFGKNKHSPYFQAIVRSLSGFTHTFLFFGVLFDELCRMRMLCRWAMSKCRLFCSPYI